MSRRKVSVLVDPEACAAGLAALEALARDGREGLGEAVSVLRQIVTKPAPREARGPFVKVHMAKGWQPGDFSVETCCGVHGPRALHMRDSNIATHVAEVDTALCDIIEVTAAPDLVTCVRCLRSLAKRAG